MIKKHSMLGHTAALAWPFVPYINDSLFVERTNPVERDRMVRMADISWVSDTLSQGNLCDLEEENKRRINLTLLEHF